MQVATDEGARVIGLHAESTRPGAARRRSKGRLEPHMHRLQDVVRVDA